jgi:chromosomal replication initiator protein
VQTTLFREAAGDPPAAANPVVAEFQEKPLRWTFADFVVGASNAQAARAAREAAEQPGRFTPLVLYGPPGCGKSHLLNAVGRHVRNASMRARMLHISSEQFTTQFLEALDRRALPSFRHKMRTLDLILVDDVQFFERKRATLEEFLYTVDALHGRHGQIVLTSDRPPADLQALSPGLASRIGGGLAIAIELPDCATRVGIVRAMAHRMRIPLSEDVIELVAQHIAGSGRLLNGAINRLVAASMALKKPITVELAGEALAEFCRLHWPKVRLADIQRAVCEVFGVESSSLKSPSKARGVAEPRMLAMWLARRHTRAALSEIGDFFGRRSHSTVVSAQRKFDGMISRRQSIVVDGQACPVEDAVRRIETALRSA